MLFMAELVFLQRELHFCEEDAKEARGSLRAAIRNGEDALRSWEVVKDASLYRVAEKTYLTDPQIRIEACPRDAFHQACTSHLARLGNSLRTPGMNKMEQALLRQRIDNMYTAQDAYLGLQKTALTGN